MHPEAKSKIAVLGGTGKEGSGLAFRWANAGHHVFIGSRSPERAQAAAAAINARIGANLAGGSDNLAAAQHADIVVLTVPYAAQLATLQEVKVALAGKILIDVTVPLVPPQVGRVQLPDGGSAVVKAQAVLARACGWCRRSRMFRRSCWTNPVTSLIATCWCAATTARRVNR